MCDELGFNAEAEIYRKLLTDAGFPHDESNKLSNVLGLDSAQAPKSRAIQQRAVSNYNTAGKVNRLVGANTKATIVPATNARPAR